MDACGELKITTTYGEKNFITCALAVDLKSGEATSGQKNFSKRQYSGGCLLCCDFLVEPKNRLPYRGRPLKKATL